MLIHPEEVKNYAECLNISIKGILHVGAHICEEKYTYNNIFNISDENIIWVEANPKLVEYNKQHGIRNCYSAVLDKVKRSAIFNITNNGESSSLLTFGTHKDYHPHVTVNEKIEVETETLGDFYKRTGLCSSDYNFWNFDIQGSELDVLKGSPELLKDVDMIYTEVNTEEVYEGCGLLSELDTFLEAHGLNRIAVQMTDYNWGDAIYARV